MVLPLAHGSSHVFHTQIGRSPTRLDHRQRQDFRGPRQILGKTSRSKGQSRHGLRENDGKTAVETPLGITKPPRSPYGSDCTFRVVGPVSVEQQQNQVLTAGSAKTGRQRTTTAVCWSSPAAVGPPAVVGPPAAVGPKGPLDKLDWPLDSNLFPMAPLHIISESPTSSPTSRSRQLTDERSHPCRTGTQTQPNIQST